MLMLESIMHHQSHNGPPYRSQFLPWGSIHSPKPQTPEASEPCIQYPSIQLPSQTMANQSCGTAPRKRTTPDSQEGSMAGTGMEGFERHESETVEGPSRKQSCQTCQKCGRGEGCRGNTGVKNCTYSCRDCGRIDCVGRNSQNLKQRCSTRKKV